MRLQIYWLSYTLAPRLLRTHSRNSRPADFRHDPLDY